MQCHFLLFVCVFQIMFLLGFSAPSLERVSQANTGMVKNVEISNEVRNFEVGPCEMVKQSAVEPSPLCDVFGYFNPVQCYLDGCHCVDSYGNPTKTFDTPKYYISIQDCERHGIVF